MYGGRLRQRAGGVVGVAEEEHRCRGAHGGGEVSRKLDVSLAERNRFNGGASDERRFRVDAEGALSADDLVAWV